MAVPELTTATALQRSQFHMLWELFDRLKKDGYELDTLSMGMSEDMDIAIAEGATMVRIGTAIFGPRRYPIPEELARPRCPISLCLVPHYFQWPPHRNAIRSSELAVDPSRADLTDWADLQDLEEGRTVPKRYSSPWFAARPITENFA